MLRDVLPPNAGDEKRGPSPIPSTWKNRRLSDITRAEVAQWGRCTSGRFQLRLFSGGHFFINDARGQLLKTLAADLATVPTEGRATPAASIASLNEAV